VAFALEINSPQERKAPSGNFRFAPNGIDSNISFHLGPSKREWKCIAANPTRTINSTMQLFTLP